MAEINAFVYGCNGLLNKDLFLPDSTILPKYITETVSQRYFTTLRSCEINK